MPADSNRAEDKKKHLEKSYLVFNRTLENTDSDNDIFENEILDRRLNDSQDTNFASYSVRNEVFLEIPRRRKSRKKAKKRAEPGTRDFTKKRRRFDESDAKRAKQRETNVFQVRVNR